MCINIVLNPRFVDNEKLFSKFGTAVKIFTAMNDEDTAFLNLYRYHSRSEHSKKRRDMRVLEREVSEGFEDAEIATEKRGAIIFKAPKGVQMLYMDNGMRIPEDVYNVKNGICRVNIKKLRAFLKNLRLEKEDLHER